jgi:uncharacterized protein YjdB
VSLSAPKTVLVGKKNALVADASPVSTWSFSSSNPKVASVGALTGVMKGLKAGKVTITATLNADPSIKLTKKVRIVKKNPLSVKAKTKRVKYTRLKSKSVKVKAIVIKKKGKGKMSFAKIAEGSSTRLSVNRKTGKVKVKKGTVRGVYLMSVRVKAAGNAKYQSASKVVKVKVVVE